MCGIAGYINGDTKSDERSISSMIEAVHHRGPDNKSIFTHDRTALGHARLSIIDLDEKSNQPFFSDDLNLILVFNGEIYNYLEIKSELEHRGILFKTKSDMIRLNAFS